MIYKLRGFSISFSGVMHQEVRWCGPIKTRSFAMIATCAQDQIHVKMVNVRELVSPVTIFVKIATEMIAVFVLDMGMLEENAHVQ